MRINHDWLRTFVDAGTARTFADAATTRGVSPSAISQQVRALERELGMPLFERVGRRVRLTAEGAALLVEVRDALARLDGAIEAVAERHERVSGEVAIGSPRSFGGYWLRPRLARLLARHDELRLRVTFGVPTVLEQQLADGALDLALLVRPTRLDGIEVVPVARETFLAVASPAHLAATGVPTTLDDFRRRRWIRFDPDEAMHGPWWRAAFGRTAPGPDAFVCEIASLEEMLAAVEAGAGMAVLPDYLLAEPIAAGRVVVVAPPGPVRRTPGGTIHLAWRRGLVGSARVRAVRDALREAS